MKKQVFCRAPVRICDIGGWTDTWYYPRGAVFNICIDLYSYVRIIENELNTIRIFAENFEKQVEIPHYSDIKYDENLDLLKAAIKRLRIEENIDIFVRSDAPPGCGTGTSASIAVALIAALKEYLSESYQSYEVAEIAHKLEVEELKVESGVQDQYAAAYGGFNFMEIDYPSVKLSQIEISQERIIELESQFILVYLSSRSSSEMHKAVIKNYQDGDEQTINSFEILKDCAYEMRDVINEGRIKEIGNIISKNWEAQKNLHSLMVNPIISKLEKIALDNGAVGLKCNGAGGGGSMIILAGFGNEYFLKKKIIENGFTILPFKFGFKGVTSFSYEK